MDEGALRGAVYGRRRGRERGRVSTERIRALSYAFPPFAALVSEDLAVEWAAETGRSRYLFARARTLSPAEQHIRVRAHQSPKAIAQQAPRVSTVARRRSGAREPASQEDKCLAATPRDALWPALRATPEAMRATRSDWPGGEWRPPARACDARLGNRVSSTLIHCDTLARQRLGLAQEGCSSRWPISRLSSNQPSGDESIAGPTTLRVSDAGADARGRAHRRARPTNRFAGSLATGLHTVVSGRCPMAVPVVSSARPPRAPRIE